MKIESAGELRQGPTGSALGRYSDDKARWKRRDEKMSRSEPELMDGFSAILGESLAIRNIKRQLKKISASDFPVLITGETGTGKNLLAKEIHLNSPRARGPFVAVNCAAIPESLLESELFGHSRGAFTGAIADRRGLFEEASGGTIFLDEIGLVTKALQAKLLGVLQDKVVRKIGSNREISVDARVITATNADLFTGMRKGEFREDLYYRLNVLHLHVPALREHREDIPILAEYFISVCASTHNKHALGFTPAAMDILCGYEYPGNVRQLSNIVCNAVIQADSDFIDSEDIEISAVGPQGALPDEEGGQTDGIWEWERQAILKSMSRNPGNLDAVSRELRIGRTTLWRKMKKYKIMKSPEHGIA